MVIGSNQVMEKSNLTSRFDNHDYDGDSLIALALHSEEAREDFKYAYVKNLVEFEHLDELLIDYEHESIFSAYMLTLMAKENIFPHIGTTTQEVFDLFEKEFNLENMSEYPGASINYTHFGNLTNIEAAINQVLCKPFQLITQEDIYPKEPIYLISRDGLLTKKALGKLTVRFWNIVKEFNKIQGFEMVNFWDTIHEMDKFFLECSTSVGFCNPSFDLQDFVVYDQEIEEFKENLITVEPFIAFHQNMVLFEKVSHEINKHPDNILNRVFKSGARLKSVQLLKAASNTGIPTDIYGKAFPANIKNSLLDGLTPEEYFITGDSARLALAVRQEAIPKGGELQRKFFFTVGILKLDREVYDCGTKKYYEIEVENMSHLKLLNHRWRFNEETQEEELIDISDSSLVGKTIKLRSPVTCKNPDYKICTKCFGEKVPESVNLGSTVGAALSEGIIQSVLRAHHFGGAFIATEDKHLMEILRRSEFKAPDTIISDPQDIEYIVEYLNGIYPEEDWEYETLFLDKKTGIKIKINELPFNDDSVKQLNSIVGLIDKNRDQSSLIDPKELYKQLELVIEQNGILSVYLELIISLLYYDEDGILYRYTDKDPYSQVALKNIIEVLDPKLSIFYNFSNRIISKIYNHESLGHIDHMYHDLLDVYY
jgi:hypothetical protein